MNKLLSSVVLLISLLSAPLALSQTLTFAFSESDPPVSSSFNGDPVGLFPDMVRLVFSLIPEYDVKLEAYPWARAQLLVESGQINGFMTYPSSKRKAYAVFSDEATFIQDYGYLIYLKDSPHRSTIEKSRSFEELKDLTAIVENGAEWERDNVAKYVTHVNALNQEMMIHLLCLRKEGDFLVMPPENAKHIAQKFGYQKNITYSAVKYINDSLIPFHIGISKKHDKADLIIGRINEVKNSKVFQAERQKLIDRYR